MFPEAFSHPTRDLLQHFLRPPNAPRLPFARSHSASRNSHLSLRRDVSFFGLSRRSTPSCFWLSLRFMVFLTARFWRVLGHAGSLSRQPPNLALQRTAVP